MFNLPIKVLAQGKLTIFLFHKVPLIPDPVLPNEMDLPAFEHLLDTVVSCFSVIPYEEAVAGLTNDCLPPRAACITFDDGYESWLQGVVPVLEKRQLHATFFITTGQFEGRALWHERIAHAVKNWPTEAVDISHPAFPVAQVQTPEQRTGVVLALENFLKYLTLEVRNELLVTLEQGAGVTCDQVTRMSVADLKAIHQRGFGIGAHTVDHPILTYCDEVQALHEIGAAREILEGYIGAPVRSFAYPNGRPYADYSASHVELVKRAGYASAVTTQPGVGVPGRSVFQIPRVTPWAKAPLRVVLQLGRNLMVRPDRVEE